MIKIYADFGNGVGIQPIIYGQQTPIGSGQKEPLITLCRRWRGRKRMLRRL